MAEVIFEKAKKVSSPLNISLNGGTTEGTNKFTYDGSSTKTLNITPASIGAAASNHSHSLATTSANGFLSSADKALINSIGTPSTLITTSKQLVGAINEVKTNVNSINSWSIDISETIGQHGNDINHLFEELGRVESDLIAKTESFTRINPLDFNDCPLGWNQVDSNDNIANAPIQPPHGYCLTLKGSTSMGENTLQIFINWKCDVVYFRTQWYKNWHGWASIIL